MKLLWSYFCRVLLALIVGCVVGVVSSVDVYASCSPYAGATTGPITGKISINEYNYAGGYIELKIIDPSILSATNNLAGWMLSLIKKQGNGSTRNNYSVADYLSSCGQDSPYTKIPTGQLGNDSVVVLWSDSAMTQEVDYFRIGQGAYPAFQPSTCFNNPSELPASSAVTYHQAALTGSSARKDIARGPDGTGKWLETPFNGNDQGTPCSSNDGVLAIIKSVAPSTVSLGGEVIFRVAVSLKVGALTQSNVKVTDVLPSGLEYVGHTVSIGTYSSTTGIWTIGSLSSGQVVTLDLTAKTTQTGVLTNRAVVESVDFPAGTVAPAIATVTCSAGLDHYEIIHDGSALTCAPEDVRIAACADAARTTLAATPATVTLTPAGWVGGDSKTFTGSAEVQLIHTAPATVTLGISAQSPLAINGYRCVRTLGGATVSCGMQFYESGFDFDVPTLTSCQESGDITISAVGRDPLSGRCVPLFASQTVAVPFWSTYMNPNTGTQAVKINGASIAAASPGTPVSLAFDANGQATFKVTYSDAGQIQLNARYLGAGSMAGLEMLGSDSFVTAPAGLCVYSDEVNSDCASGDAACSVFKAAGASFALKVKGVCWQSAGEVNAQFCDNTTTPNFRMDNIALTHTLVAPSSSGVAGTLGVSTANISSSGEVSVSQSVSEVGVFTFTADPPDDYLGVSGIFTGTTFTSANIGRFIPHHFDVALSPNPPAFADTCTGGGASFTYLGQPFNWAVVPQWTLRAMNTASVLTQNYEGSFWKLANPLSSYSYVDTTVPAGAGPLTPSASSQLLPDTSNCGGTVTMSLTEASGFNYTRPTLSSPISPFAPNVSLTITQARLTDADNVCYDLGGGAGCQGFEVTGITGNHLRHGQTWVMNNFGPETADITNSPFEVRYYNGTAWIVNDADNCTTGLSFCPSARITDIAPDPVAGGKGTMTVSSLSVPETLPVCPVAPAWLTSLTDCTALDSSCGEFTFGIYRGNDRIINWREVLR